MQARTEADKRAETEEKARARIVDQPARRAAAWGRFGHVSPLALVGQTHEATVFAPVPAAREQ